MTEHISQPEYNQRFLERLKTRRPDLLALAQVATYEGVEYVKIEIPPPEGQREAIVVSTYGRELTMFYHAHHAHFDMYDDGDEKNEFGEFFGYIDAFMNEAIVSVLECNGDRWCRSRDARADETIEPKAKRQVIVKSWKGTYSRTIQ